MKIIDLMIYCGVLCVFLCACSANQLGKTRSLGDASPLPVQELITFDNAGSVVLLRSLDIPDYLRGELSQCSLDFSPDGQLLVAACGLNAVPVWDVNSWEVRYSLYKDDPAQIVACAFSPDGKSIACGGFDNVITLWNVASGERIRELGSSKSPIWELAFSPDGRKIASASFSDDICLWDVKSGSMLWVTTGLKGILSVTYNSSDETIAYGTRLLNRAGILNAARGEVLSTLSGPPDNVGDIEASPDGALIAAGCDDNKVYLWNSNDYQPVGILAGHSGYVNGVGFNPDGTLLASGSHDKTVGIWDVIGKKHLVSLPGHEDVVLRVEFSPDGKFLASISWDGTVKVWGVKSGN
ncbi:MAG: WD40 repeat domain-containing protein [Anaerolineaceae bacterium]